MGIGRLVFLVTVVLLPIVPAWLLYRLLPSSADVEGPWQGLKIKLGGAFAGYFLLVVTLLAFWRLLPTYEVWSVEGRLRFADDQGAFDKSLVHFSVLPPGSSVSPDGRFEVSVFATPDPSGNIRLPTLVVEHPGYQPAGIFLEDLEEKNGFTRRVVIPDTVELEPIPGDPGRGGGQPVPGGTP